MTAPVQNARCKNHPDAAAVAVCARCGLFLCGACVEVMRESSYCADCARRQFGPGSNRAAIALVLSLLGFTFLVLPGIVGLILGHRELRAIDRGESPETGRTFAMLAFILGIIDVVLLVILVTSVVGFALFVNGEALGQR